MDDEAKRAVAQSMQTSEGILMPELEHFGLCEICLQPVSGFRRTDGHIIDSNGEAFARPYWMGSEEKFVHLDCVEDRRNRREGGVGIPKRLQPAVVDGRTVGWY